MNVEKDLIYREMKFHYPSSSNMESFALDRITTHSPIRHKVSNPIVLTGWRALSVLACLIGAVICPLAVGLGGNEQESVKEVSMQSALIVRAQIAIRQARHDVEMASLSSSEQMEKSARDHLSEAMISLSQIPDSHGGVRNTIAQLSGDLIDQVARSEKVIAQKGEGLSDLQAKSDEIDLKLNDLKSNLDDPYIWDEIPGEIWGMGLGISPVVLFIASIAVARRTKRLINLGLITALALTSTGGWMGSDLIASTYGYGSAYTRYSSIKMLSEADLSLSNLMLRQPLEGKSDIDTAISSIVSALVDSGVEGGEAERLGEQVRVLTERLSTADDEERLQVMQEAQDLQEKISSIVSENIDDLLDDENMDSSGQGVLPLISALFLGAAVASGVGVTSQIKRYR